MTATGTPIFLVSACASADEFVAAFRRYADRVGIFIPMAEPLPAGRAGRIALTLSDGGVMIEGEAQIIQSSAKPAGLYGRAGITLKFVTPDEPSRKMLDELARARLAPTPPKPTVAPRRADVPASPRATPPAVGGRIDAANALAESVAIGDVSTLREQAGNASGGLPKAGQKFVVPTISSAGPRARTPSSSGSLPPVTAAASDAAANEATELGAAPVPVTTGASGGVPKASPTSPSGRVPAPSGPTVPMAAPPAAMPAPAAAGAPAPRPTSLAPSRKPTMIGVPVVGPKAGESGTFSLDKLTGRSPLPSPPRRRGQSTAPPPLPRNPTPVVPLPIALRPPPAPATRPPAPLAGVEVSAEATEISAPPSGDLPTQPEPPLVAASLIPPEPPDPAEHPTLTAEALDIAAEEEKERLAKSKQSEVKPLRSGGMRASEIMAAIPTDDWTMSPDASEPVVMPKGSDTEQQAAQSPSAVIATTTPPNGPPTGDWTIAKDPSRPDGWSSPSKVNKLVPPRAKAATGNPVVAVSSEKALVVQQWQDKGTGLGEPLVEIDSTLMQTVTSTEASAPTEPLPPTPGRAPTEQAPSQPPLFGTASAPMQAFDATQPQLPPAAAIPGMFPPAPPPPMPSAPPMYHQFDASSQVGMMGFPYHDAATGMSGGYHLVQRRRKRVIMVAGAAVLAVITAVIVVIVTSKNSSPVATPAGGSAEVAVPTPTPTPTPAGSGSAHVAEVTQPPTETPKDPVCTVDVTTTPAGAQVTLDKTALGTTPGKFTLPCGAEAKLRLTKPRYFGVVKSVTPTTEGAKLDVALSSAIFTVKVTSMPSGATVTVGGKPSGVTPTSIKVPAYEASAIVVAKDGFASDSQRVVPRREGMLHHVTLKKAAPRPVAPKR